MQLTGPSLCQSCKHLSKVSDPDLGMPITCTAYPKGIPSMYFTGGKAHVAPDGNDGGIVYQLNPNRDLLLQDYLQFHPDVEIP